MADEKTTTTKKESESVEQTIKDTKGLEPGPAGGPSGVQSVTESLPAESPGSKTVDPTGPDTNPEAPPLHTGRPDVPIAQTLAAGAGEHTPPDPDEYAPSGRPKDIEEN